MTSLAITPTLAGATVSVLEEARARRDGLIVQAKSIVGVQDRIDADDAMEVLKALNTFSREIEAQRTLAKAPVLDLGRKIDQLGKELVAQVEAEAARISRIVGAFEAEQRRIADEARREAELRAYEATRKAQEAAQAEKAKQQAPEQTARAIDAIVEKAQAEIVQAKTQAANLQASKHEGAKLIKTIKFEVTDIKALYAEEPTLVNLEPNTSAIKAIIKANPNIQLPGLRHWIEESISTR